MSSFKKENSWRQRNQDVLAGWLQGAMAALASKEPSFDEISNLFGQWGDMVRDGVGNSPAVQKWQSGVLANLFADMAGHEDGIYVLELLHGARIRELVELN